MEFPVFEVVRIASFSCWAPLRRAPSSSRPRSDIYAHGTDPSKPLLLQAEQSQLPHSLDMLQTLNQLNGSLPLCGSQCSIWIWPLFSIMFIMSLLFSYSQGWTKTLLISIFYPHCLHLLFGSSNHTSTTAQFWLHYAPWLEGHWWTRLKTVSAA